MHSAKYIAILSTLAAMLSACATPTNSSRFYTLSNVQNNQGANINAAAPIAIEVVRVNVPERLKRPQLVISTSNATQLKILEHSRWSSSFDDELQDAFVSGITSQLGAIDVSRGGRMANQTTYRIAVVLQQFNATPGEQVLANFGWTITRLNTSKSPADTRSLSCQVTISKTVANDIDAVVKGVQDAVADAVQTISANVSSLNNGELPKCSS